MRSEESETIDRLLEEALSSYSAEEPPSGLEQRICQRIHAGAPRPAFPKWVWAIPVAACLILTAIVWMRRDPKPDRREFVRTAITLPAPDVRPSEAATRRTGVRRHLRRSEFPAPRPITHEERALLALVARAPELAREAFQDFAQRNGEPIRIEAIKIQPLQSDGLK